ncbi:hypothetical protein Aph01nite_04160 [Acrocarpospora phusangensis]|uniref:Uncharacterized protein n=1 Tax=Acrocarpospora phusangensis TaxID=1070424 RepID=A0A919Q4Q7_9ACTN|nr:hypothetical protein Aph01nite_04160 [Acrocarpospora phusangensis]
MKSWPTFSSTVIFWRAAVTRETASARVGVMEGAAEGADTGGRVARPAEEFSGEHATTMTDVRHIPAQTRTRANLARARDGEGASMFSP